HVRIAEQTANYMRIDQGDNTASTNWVLNWSSFNIDAGSRVQFVQPGVNHIALNRIAGGASVIRGQIDANGRIYLINPNGFLFGSSSVINVNSLVASSLALNISDDDFINNNINLLNVIDNGGAAFIDGSGAGVIEIQGPTYDPNGLMIDPGAQIAANAGGNILIIAPEIINGGSITTRSGQVVLAAAQDSVYLTPSNDPALRGFLIELGGTGGKVENAGNILAERGNITLAGLAINQDGLLQATSSINENGSIRLLARDHATTTSVDNNTDDLLLGIDTAQTDANGLSTRRNEYYVSTQTGEVNLGGTSQIIITPDNTDTSLVVDDQKINASRVELTGHAITMRAGAGIVASGGEVLLHANSNPQQTALNSSGILREDRAADTSLITLEAGSSINVSGTTDTHVAMERNQLEVQLTGDFLRDAPLQRDGALRNERVNVDIRDGTPLGDISADVAANVKRSISERLSAGGSVELLSQGGVAMQQGSEVNIAGGAVTYDAGYVSSNQLVTAQGQVVGIADASPDLAYTGLVGSLSITSDRWGSASERRWSLFGGNNAGISRYYDSYTEGQDAGHFSIHAPAIAGMADVTAGAAVTPQLRSTAATEPTDALPNTGRAWGGTLEIITRGQQIEVVSSAVDPVLEDMNDWLENSANSLPDFAFQIDDDVFNSGLSNVTFTEDHSSETAVYGGRFDIQSDAQIRMASSGSLSVDSGSINVHGNIDIDAGAVTLNSSALTRVDNAIDVSGSWVNDSLEPGNDVTVPVDVNAGSITIKASHLDLTDNSQLIANGGGWLQANGKLQSGEGGDIKLVADHPTDETSEFTMHGSLQAFGVNHARGGSLSITANRIHLAPEITTAETGLLQFTPEFFTQNGFADYALTANKSDMHVAAGSVITPRAGSLLLNSNAA
ncbi:MAG: filamentous hemagglutinin N-terminal domain-containing protein, partial [Gammaproteobacteria bacterium]|nr:filamentous hemagglutinin N-terminal domain-containing protein [Gammaproteobacteria bacterium]